MNETTTDRLVSQLVASEPDMIELVAEFVRGLPDRVREMREAQAKSDFELLRTLAHRLKGAGGSYGFPPISRLAGALEQQFARHDASGFATGMAELERLVESALAGLD